MRLKRGLKTDEIDNFFVNQLQGFTDAINSITGTMNWIGVSLACFPAGGWFGIANIMFVSVKERTSLIGIQKSLRDQAQVYPLPIFVWSYDFGCDWGAVGLILVYLASLIVSAFTGDFWICSFSLQHTN